MTLILLGVFFGLLLLNVPVAASMGIAAAVGICSAGLDLSAFPTMMYSSIAKSTLLAIPYFIVAGVIMEYSGISERLIDFVKSCVGHRKGGLAIVTVVVACFFAAISGSGPATVAALGGVLIPAMVHAGYDKNFSTALLASSGGIGMVIPPSIPFVVYGMLAQVSVGTMFIGGIVPGLLMGLAFCIAALIGIRKDTNLIPQKKCTARERWDAFKKAIWGLLMPVIILGGIYSGIFTPTEAAGIAVVYGLIVGIFVYKKIKLKTLWNLIIDSSVTSAIVMYIMGCAGVFTWVLTATGVAKDLTSALLSITDNKFLLLLIFNVIFLIAGCFIDVVSGFYIMLPIMMPIVVSMNYNVYAFGVMMVANFAIGQITPPVGGNLFIGCRIANITMRDLCSRVGPFIVAGLGAVLLMTYVPQIITFLPSLLGMH